VNALPYEVQIGLAWYYVVGLAWMSSGFLPEPFGWIRNKMVPLACIGCVVFFGAVWPLVLGKIFYFVVWRGQEEIEL
jgi:hypothetical protein